MGRFPPQCDASAPIARLYGVWVDDLYKPSVKGYENNAQRLMAVYEHSHKPVDYLAAAEEFEKLFRTEIVTPDDWRTYGVLREYMVYHCIKKATASYQMAMDMARCTDSEMYHRTRRQSILLRCRIGQAADCIAAQEAVVHEHPDNAAAWGDLAHALFSGGRAEDALRWNISRKRACCMSTPETPAAHSSVMTRPSHTGQLPSAWMTSTWTQCTQRPSVGATWASLTRPLTFWRPSPKGWADAVWKLKPNGRGKWQKNAATDCPTPDKA